MTDTRTAHIDTADLPEFASRVAALNVRADKLGVDHVTYVVTERQTVKRHVGDFEGSWTVSVEVATVEISGGIPRLPGGWHAIGVVTHEAGGNLVTDLRSAPESADGWTLAEATRVENYRHAGPNCEHCNLRRNRAKTIILENESGDIKQVGSTCLADFLGLGVDPERLVGWTTDAGSLDDFDNSDGGFRARAEVEVQAYVAAAAASVRTHGWTARSAEGGYFPTADVALHVIDGTRPRATHNRYGSVTNQRDIDYVAEVEVNDDDRATAAAAIAWAQALPANSTDYLGNLRTVCSQEFASRRHVGLLASVVTAATRDADRAARAAAKAAKTTSPVPQTDERILIEGTVISTGEKEAFTGGIRYVFTVEDDRGFRVWGTIPKGIDVGRGDRVQFSAKVERSDRDEAFGFFSRPTKAKVLVAS